mmetsp:Transcript_24224/g.39801  ORF Transcript_24224/g.39801 Transcript_24224/m.39801 type:complete len:118 (-) Transcript_24224:4816-5169(-)
MEDRVSLNSQRPLMLNNNYAVSSSPFYQLAQQIIHTKFSSPCLHKLDSNQRQRLLVKKEHHFALNPLQTVGQVRGPSPSLRHCGASEHNFIGSITCSIRSNKCLSVAKCGQEPRERL